MREWDVGREEGTRAVRRLAGARRSWCIVYIEAMIRMLVVCVLCA